MRRTEPAPHTGLLSTDHSDMAEKTGLPPGSAAHRRGAGTGQS